LWGIAEIGDQPEREAVDADDPLFILDQRYSRREIVAACAQIEGSLGNHTLGHDLTPLKRDILRLCVEKTCWLDAYLIPPFSQENLDEAEDTLVDLAGCLALLGIEGVVPMRVG
jgi:hypothetical protein